MKQNNELYLDPDDMHMAIDLGSDLCKEKIIINDIEIDAKRLNELVKADKDGRLIILPTSLEGYEPEYFYQVRFFPRCCNEDHCDNCRYANKRDDCKFGDECKFKPYIAELSRERVFSAAYTLINLCVSKEEAKAVLERN